VFDGSTDSCFKLNDSLTLVGDLVVDNDLQVERIFIHDPLDGLKVTPNVVGVEDLELSSRAELIQVVFWHLGDLEKPDSSLVVDDCTTLDVGLGLVGDLHDVLGLTVDHCLHDVEVHDGTQVVDVGDEDVLLSSRNELLEETRVVQGIEDVTVSRWVPVGLVTFGLLRTWEKRLFVNSWVSRLVEGEDVDVVVLVFLDDSGSVLVGVERVHEDEWDVDTVGLVEVLNLPNGQVEEGHAVPDLDDGLGSDTAHCGTETTVELEHGQLVKNGRVNIVEDLVGLDLLWLRSSDLVPLDLLSLGSVRQESVEQQEEGLHLGVEDPLLLLVGDVSHHSVELIPHGFGSNTGGSGLEVHCSLSSLTSRRLSKSSHFGY